MHELTKELKLLASLRQAKADLFDAIVDHAVRWRARQGTASLTREEIKALRSDNVAHVAEFFYVVRERSIAEPANLRPFIERHNADMMALLESCERGYTASGLLISRIRRAMFSEPQIAYLEHECSGGTARFDQFSLARIFTQLMAFESCRKLLVLLSDSGFLNRQEYNQVLISSKGVLEDLFHDFLSKICAQT